MSQRTAMMVCRYNNLPAKATGLMMPYWQVLLSYFAIFSLFILFILIWVISKWYFAIGLGLMSFLITTFIPISYYYFLNKFENDLKNPRTKKTTKNYDGLNDELKVELLAAIDKYRKESERRG
jgi:ABC-type transport system involved in cytochrome bd biosynthesis fused ATPase/permease subunit